MEGGLTDARGRICIGIECVQGGVGCCRFVRKLAMVVPSMFRKNRGNDADHSSVVDVIYNIKALVRVTGRDHE